MQLPTWHGDSSGAAERPLPKLPPTPWGILGEADLGAERSRTKADCPIHREPPVAFCLRKAWVCCLSQPACLHVKRVSIFGWLTIVFYGNRYVAATASRQAAGEALKQTVDLAEEHSCIEAEERSLKLIGRMNESWLYSMTLAGQETLSHYCCREIIDNLIIIVMLALSLLCLLPLQLVFVFFKEKFQSEAQKYEVRSLAIALLDHEWNPPPKKKEHKKHVGFPIPHHRKTWKTMGD